MKKKILITIILTVTASKGFSQEATFFMQNFDSIKHELAIAKSDTSRVLIMEKLCLRYSSLSLDSAKRYGQMGLDLARQINFSDAEIRILSALGGAFQINGDIPASLELLFKALKLAEEKHYDYGTAFSVSNIGIAYWYLKDYDKAISDLKKAGQLLEAIPDAPYLYDVKIINYTYLGNAYTDNNEFDSAFSVLQKIYNETLHNYWHFGVMESYGYLLFKMGDHEKGLDYLRQCIEPINGEDFTVADAARWIAECYSKINKQDSAIYFAKIGLAVSQKINYTLGIISTSKVLANTYESSDLKQSHDYLKLYISANDELYGEKKVLILQKTIAEEQERQRIAEADRIAYENKLKQYAFLAGLAILLLTAFILYRNNLREKKAKNLLKEKNKVIEQTLTNHKSTQAQLIQSEKMASLGELTAGIAHEIQNPLNFVNNFSEVSNELIDEMNTELDKGDIEEAKAIAADVKQNLEKINHHGKRADAIVKGMLQHSRSSSGVKEPTDINALCDEYLRLSYHGLRAKDKSFNATIKTDFDPSIGNINIIPQDIGRVVLNLLTNAFYVVDEKKKTPQPPEGGVYDPTVSISTKKMGDKVEIKVSDNGNGIPPKVLDKIFQPFFTTKPTGQGTGLGLSLSYDIIKAHGGEIKVETKEGEGSEFIIQLQNHSS